MAKKIVRVFLFETGKRMIDVTQDAHSVLKVYFLSVSLEVKVLSRNIHENNGGQTVKHILV